MLPKAKHFLKEVSTLFVLLGVVFIPFPFHLFPFQQAITEGLFKSSIAFVSENILGLRLTNPEISSDSTYMYILVVLLFILAVIVATLLPMWKRWNTNKASVFAIFRQLFCWYLALQLLKYGFDKVFKCQFYLPEPNLLYTPLGQLDKDILFWSSMGTSYTYNLFMGSAELLAGVLILFRKTRTLGLVLATGVFVNVVAINFGFDISVKLYSVLLLFIALFLLAPQLNSFYRFFILHKMTCLEPEPTLFKLSANPFAGMALQLFVIGLLFTEALYPYVKNGNFNDDTAQRPFLHGAYEVMGAYTMGDSAFAAALPVKRLFIHREGFIIFQDQQDEMQDFKLDINQATHQFTLTDYNLNKTKLNFVWHTNDSVLELQYISNSREYMLRAKAIDWKKLPALQNKFHWMVERVD